ncbi:transmembrane protein 150C-like [Cololabis saira]|uniref:transmembrane protein 150C-like n=1 Tax=Cololabis saira TaxID=129043 RepID=UPI002AD29EBD|nr:transmembrane protein 150C-like [Cololabis saira]
MLDFSLWALLPPLFSVCAASGLWAVYFVALYDEKVLPLDAEQWKGNGSRYPPFISVTGQFPPASCIFSEVMNLMAFGAFIIGLLRYVQLKNRIDKAWLNAVSLVIFSIACLGMTIVGNFQLFTLWTAHMVGTEMAFGLGTLFCWMQSYITLRVNLKNEGKLVAVARFLLSASITLCIIIKYSMSSAMDSARWQWTVVMLFLVFIGTFGIEFRHGHFSLLCTDAADRSLAHMSNIGDSENSQQIREQLGPL